MGPRRAPGGALRLSPRIKLEIVPCTLRAAREFIARHHRHHLPPQGGLFAVAVAAQDPESGEERLCGVAILGRPVARHLADGRTVELTRCCTDGTSNACSALYGAAWRAARALGYRRLITYTLASEPGTSLKAAGWRVVAQSRGGSWGRASRPREDQHPLSPKLRWEAGESFSEKKSSPPSRPREQKQGKLWPTTDLPSLSHPQRQAEEESQ